MEIINPPRISSLEPQRVRIITHNAEDATSESTLTNIFPFETLYMVKQRIALTHYEEAAWLPNRIFIAEAGAGGKFRPLEFTWTFAKQLVDPFTLRGQPNSELYEDDARKSVFPTVLSGITLENALTTDERIIHVWTLGSLLRALHINTSANLSEPLLGGFIQLYFPTLLKEHIKPILAPAIQADDKIAFEVIKTYIESLDMRYRKLQTGLAARIPTDSVTLNELRALKFALPKKEAYGRGALELVFYEMKPTETLPFIRFFPKQDKTAPLIKLAATSHGGTMIREKRLLDALMAEQPSTDNGAVILIKSPITHIRAPLGTAWTFRIFEDGSAELYIGAPRRDAPLQTSVVMDAFRILSDVLAATPWGDNRGAQLTELTATYEYKYNGDEGKPAPAELRKRIDAFLPMFYEDKPPVVAGLVRPVVSLRYKSVSNFSSDTNPIVSFISSLFLHDGTRSIEAAPIQTYIAALAREFGIPPTEAAELINDWIKRHAEHVLGNDSTVIPTYSLGTAVGLYNNHPRYLFSVAGCESTTDLSRIVSLMTVFVAEDSKVLARAVEEGAESAPPVVEAPPVNSEVAPPPANDDDDLIFAMPAAEEAAPEAPSEAPSEAPPENRGGIIGDDEVLPKMDNEWYLSQLKARNKNLFDYKAVEKHVTLYSRACQHSANKQPNVLTKQSYLRAKTLYGTSVFWAEAPPLLADRLPIELAARKVVERLRYGGKMKKSFNDVVEYEKRALELGFPLKENLSVLSTDSKASPDSVRDMTERIAVQQSKPLWVVVRVGTIEDNPNYYICSEFWCVRDDLPLIPSEFEGTIFRSGKVKPPKTCPFCGGRTVRNKTLPGPGETVIERGEADKGEKVPKYAGFLKTLHHPEFYPLPCCFVEPNKLLPPDGSKIPMEVAAQEEDVVAREPAPVMDVENRDRPFSATSKKGAAQNRWYIPNQNILGRTTIDWFELEKGAVGIPPASVNELLGQNPEDFLTKNKGVLGEKINSYLTTPATAFVRYGLGNRMREPGHSLISLIAYAKYATNQYVSPNDKESIPTNAEVIDSMFGEKEIEFARAFIQANYGTLVHEFSVPGITLSQLYTEGQLTEWCRRMDIRLPQQRAYAENLFIAWKNFENYVKDTKEVKELRLWELLFATPGLLTRTGFLVVTIQIGRDGKSTILCPRFGVSARAQYENIPLMFILEDSKTGIYDPLVLYEGMTKESKLTLGVIQAEGHAFGALNPKTRAALQGFLAQYGSASNGCGRMASPIHPWIPVRAHLGVPRLSEYLGKTTDLAKMDVFVEGLIRDRSNRLVGVLARLKRSKPAPVVDLYLPCLDDGTVSTSLSSVFGEDSLPHPDLESLVDALVGKQKNKVGANRIATLFPGLLPRRLMYKDDQYVAIELDCGATIPIQHMPLSAVKKDTLHKEIKKELQEIKDDLPWDTDLSLLQPIPEEDRERLDQTSEETLNEAFQHLRIRFTNWLHTDEGKHVKRQIELLRQARKRLPLYELQKRLDILLTPIISNWLTRDGHPSNTVLRRDCLQIKTKDACIGGCSWSDGRCLIHTTSTERYVNPERVMTARLTDELLRTFGAAMEILEQKVSYLKPLDASAVVHDGTALLFSASGRGSTSLYDKLGYSTRKPGQYTQGLIYPEEVGIDMLETEGALPADWTMLEPLITAADVARDPRAMLEVAVSTLTETSLKDIEARLGRAFRGTNADWESLAKEHNLVIIMTRWNAALQRLEPYMRIQPPPAAGAGGPEQHYVVLDMQGVPLRRKGTDSMKSTRAALPATLRAWLERV